MMFDARKEELYNHWDSMCESLKLYHAFKRSPLFLEYAAYYFQDELDRKQIEEMRREFEKPGKPVNQSQELKDFLKARKGDSLYSVKKPRKPH